MLEYLVELRWPEETPPVVSNPRYRPQQPKWQQQHRRVSAPDEASAAYFARVDVARERGISVEHVHVLEEPRARPVASRVDHGEAWVNLFVDSTGRMHAGGIYQNRESCDHVRHERSKYTFVTAAKVTWEPEQPPDEPRASNATVHATLHS